MIPGWRKFNLIIDKISPEDKIGHFFIVYIKFDLRKPDEKEFLFNEIYSPIFEKKAFGSV